MKRYSQVFRFQEGKKSEPPSPEAVVALPPPGIAPAAGEQLAILVNLFPFVPHRSREIRALTEGAYWSSSGSIVARLRRALAAANRHLVLSNREAETGQKISGSLTCAVFAGEELFLGHVGPAHTFVAPRHRELIFYPQRDRLLIPLGGALPPVIHIDYTTLTEATTVMLATRAIAEAQSRDRWQNLLIDPDIEELAAQVKATAAESNSSGSLVIVRMLSDAQAAALSLPDPRRGMQLFHKQVKPAPPMATRIPPAETPPPPATTAAADADSEASSPTSSPGPKLVPAFLQPRPSKHGHAQTSIIPTPEIDGREDEEKIEPEKPPARAPIPTVKVPAAVSPDVSSLESPQSEPPSEIGEETEAPEPEKQRLRLSLPTIPWTAWRARLSRLSWPPFKRERRAPRVSLQTRLKRAGQILLPGELTDLPPTQHRATPPERTSMMSGVALGLLLLVAAITATIYLQFGGEARAQEMLEQAQEVREEVYNNQQEAEWRRLLQLSEQIITLDPQNTTAKQLRDEAITAIDSMQNAAVLKTQRLLNLGTAPVPRRLLAANGWIYILNTATDEVIGLELTPEGTAPIAEAPTTILKRGQTFYGEPVEHLVDLAWTPPGPNFRDGAIFIYSERGTLYFYEPTLGPNSITQQHIQGELGPGAVTLMETYGEKIYLVQRQENQILTYEPINGIYDAPRGYFAPEIAPHLQETLDITIDGRVYLLMGDGRVLAYFDGTPDPSFEIRNLPDIKFQPIVIATEEKPSQDTIYLGDAQNERIIVLNKRGEFLHQFRLPGEELARLEAIAVSEQPPVLYILAKNQLYAAPIPEFVSQ
ncbi:MAG: hypothetical protein ACLFTI_02540 [Anaerolineales bacterium]